MDDLLKQIKQYKEPLVIGLTGMKTKCTMWVWR